MQTITRQQAFDLLRKYNKDSFHIQHALTVEAVMNGMQRNWDMAMMPNTGELLDCCMTLILNCIRRNTA